MEYGRKNNKLSLLGLIHDNVGKEFLEKDNLLADDIVCYAIKNPMENALGKIVQPSEYPLYLVFNSDSIVSFFSHEEMGQIMKESDGCQLRHSLLSPDPKIDKSEDIIYLNALLKLYNYLDEKNDEFLVDINYLDSLIEKRNKFYGKYLLAQFYKGVNATKADEIYNNLWINSTTDEMKLYPEEFIDIMKNKGHLIAVNEEDIEFDYKEYDFGAIAPYEEVECVFYFTNNSAKRFIIHNVITTCGCTAPSWSRQPISPNARDSISVKFKTDHTGVNRKTIVIEGNCKQKIELTIKALVS